MVTKCRKVNTNRLARFRIVWKLKCAACGDQYMLMIIAIKPDIDIIRYHGHFSRSFITGFIVRRALGNFVADQ